MEFEWDDKKSALVKETRGASFEELAIAAEDGGVLGFEENPRHKGGFLFIILFKGQVWAVVTEQRGNQVRFITAYQSRKWRKKYAH